MEWKKLKNIILIILLALDVMLAVLILGPRLEGAYLQAQGRADAAAFLEGKGIRLSDIALPDPRSLTPMTVERELDGEARLAAKLLGEDAAPENLGGEVYRYTSPLGSVQFHSDGSFWAQFTPGAFPVETDPENSARDVLALLDFKGEVTDTGENFATFCQYWQGSALFSQQATVAWDDSGLLGIAGGRRLYGTPQPDPGRQTIDQSTALVHFYNGLNRLGDVCSRVDAVRPGYTAAVSLNRLTTLTPVWRVTTDTGVYQLDLVTGELSRVS